MTKKIALIILLAVIASAAVITYVKYPHGKPSALPVAEQNKKQYEKVIGGRPLYSMIEVAQDGDATLGKLLTITYNRIGIEELKSYKCFAGAREHADEQLSQAAMDKKYNSENLPWCENGENVYISDTGEGVTLDLTDKTSFTTYGADGKEKNITRADFLADISLNKTNPRIFFTFKGNQATAIHMAQ